MKYKQRSRHDPIKNYFPLPNALFSLGLTAGEIAVYSYLLYCEDRKTYQCYPSYKSIGKSVCMSPNTVRKYVAALEDKHLIFTESTTIRTKDGRSRNGSLRYTIRPFQDAVEYFHETQIQKLNKEFETHNTAKILRSREKQRKRN